MRCTICLGGVILLHGKWICRWHGPQSEIYKAPDRSPSGKALMMASWGPIVIAKKCAECGEEFTTTDRVHRWCPGCAKKVVQGRQAAYAHIKMAQI